MLTWRDIAQELRALNLAGQSAVVHASLKSFGQVQGGAHSVAAALCEVLGNVIVPTMNWGEGSAEVPAPTDDVVLQNGINAENYEGLPSRPEPFNPETSGMTPAMGAIARGLYDLPGSIRSRHPLCSWAANGNRASEFVSEQSFDDPYYPLRLLYQSGGNVLLLGVTLTSCTALHLAEQMAGRQPFIRWALCADGRVVRVRVGGCSDGFDNLLPKLDGVLKLHQIGSCRVLLARMDELVDSAANAIREEPRITICARHCVRCKDALAGGPRAD